MYFHRLGRITVRFSHEPLGLVGAYWYRRKVKGPETVADLSMKRKSVRGQRRVSRKIKRMLFPLQSVLCKRKCSPHRKAAPQSPIPVEWCSAAPVLRRCASHNELVLARMRGVRKAILGRFRHIFVILDESFDLRKQQLCIAFVDVVTSDYLGKTHSLPPFELDDLFRG